MISDETRLEAQHKLAAGRILASRKMPYFTTALMAISPFEREGLGTFAVDRRWRMYYDPEKCIEYTVPEICAVWLHEVGHLIRSHSKRFADLEGFNHDPRLFNCAGDAAINSDLRESDIILPNPEKRYYAEANAEFPEWRKGMTAEEMYFIGWRKQGNTPPDETAGDADGDTDKDEGDNSPEAEPDDTDADADGDSQESESEDDGSGDSDDNESEETGDTGEADDTETSDDEQESGNNGDGELSDEESEDDSESSGDGSEQGSDDTDNEGSDDSEAKGDSTDSGSENERDTKETENNGSDKMPDCGSAVDGEPRDYEETDTDDGSVDETTEEYLKKKTAESIMDFEKSNPGTVPGGLLREAKNILDPQVDWQTEFAALIRHVAALHAGHTDYSYQRPSRRSSGSAFILPSMRQPPAPEIIIVLDTSGSMDETKELAMALGEMEEIVNRSARFSVSQSVRIINCDAADNVAVVVRDLKDFEIIGGGGTDMRVGINAAAEMKPPADIIITITDGYTPWPKEVPYQNMKATYIALLVHRGNRKSQSPPDWMKVIEVSIPDKRRWSGPANR